MKMKKADEAHAAKANKMRHPQWAEYSGWPPPEPVAAVPQKIVAKAKKVVEAIVAPVEADEGDQG